MLRNTRAGDGASSVVLDRGGVSGGMGRERGMWGKKGTLSYT